MYWSIQLAGNGTLECPASARPLQDRRGFALGIFIADQCSSAESKPAESPTIPPMADLFATCILLQANRLGNLYCLKTSGHAVKSQ